MTGHEITSIGTQALLQFVRQYRAAGLITNALAVDEWHTCNVTHAVTVWPAVKWIHRAVDALAKQAIEERVTQFAEMSSIDAAPLVQVITDDRTGISLRVQLVAFRLRFDYRGKRD